jgi:ATP-dependent RNA helicase DDX10/DBP4
MAKSKKENKVQPINKRKQKRLNEEKELQELEVKASDPVSHLPFAMKYLTQPAVTNNRFLRLHHTPFLQQSHFNCKLFSELPISSRTLEGLKRANYIELTDIQRKAVPLGLAKRDVLGAAKTGSGKTLAFLIPVSVF